MTTIAALDCYPRSPHPRLSLDRWLLASHATTEPRGRVDVHVEVTVQGGRFFAWIEKTQVFAGGGGYPVTGRPHHALFEIPREVVLSRSDLRGVLHAATADADLVDEPAEA